MELLINIDVDDLTRAIAFYQSAFGLQPVRRFGAAGVEMRGATAPLFLLVKEAGSPAVAGLAELRRYVRHWTPVHLDVVVSEIGAAVQRAVGAGAQLEGEIHTYAWGHIAHLADPFGHGLCLIQFLGRGYDEVADPA
ncbi:VOC family protein [Chitinimonas sp.]|uniref:VOC family protein n=1 Tax=Chitinimonas sp. TaxID=1934313 RepID=UPI002F9502CA